ncbi:MAG: hypothetical protein ACYTHN_20810 [Planctomycetota bacterium]|jgi:tetratricopeptide (TPR) repeat protein
MKFFSISLLVICMGLAPVLAGEETPPPHETLVKYVERLNEAGALVREGKYLESLTVYDKAIALIPKDARGYTNKGMVLLCIWRFPEARIALTRALELDRRNVTAMVWLARCEIYDLEYVRCYKWLQGALRLSPENPDGLAVLSLLYIHLDELDRAQNVGGRALAQSPNHVFCLKINPWAAAAYIGLGQALSDLNRPLDALKVLNEGLKRNRFIPGLWATRGFVLFKLKWVVPAIRDYRKALEIDVDYSGGHHVYPFYPGSRRESAWPSGEARKILRKAIRAMEAGNASVALQYTEEAAPLAPKNLLIPLVAGAAAYALENYERSLEAARKALEIDSKSPLAHVLFITARNLKQEMKKLELSQEDFYERFKALPTPRVPGIERVFTNIDSLTLDQRKLVLLAAAPAARRLPRLEKAKAVHVILPLYRHVTDISGMKPYRERRTLDGRYWAAVRGAGGLTAVTGVESLWTATRMAFNTLAHEFGHQVHYFGLTGEEKSEVSRLYKRAKKEKRCLDYYAAENEREYFAQGYEAFVSTFKRPMSSETGKHTREDLQKKDPDLFRLIQRLADRD